MNNFFVASLLLCISFAATLSAEAKKKINLIWQSDRDTIHERDWILELLSDFEVNEIIDLNYEIYMDQSVIVTGISHKYFKKLKKKKYRFGIIHISDENCSRDTSSYDKACFVFRNYWHKKFLNQKNVSFFALGYKKEFWKDCPNSKISVSENRSYIWSFAGQILNHPTRANMLFNMKKIPNYYFHEIFSWGDPLFSLKTEEYRDLLLQSIFVPCPTGYWNLDSFRVYEALEAGCIPIVEKTPLDYFTLLFGEHPFLAVSSWDEAPDLLFELLNDPIQLEKRRQKCHEWWLNYKKEMRNKITATINSHFD